MARPHTSSSLSEAFAELVVTGLLVGGVVWWLVSASEDNDRKVASYLKQHQCHITNQIGVGRNARAIYKCKNGEWLESDLRKEALK